MGDEPFRTQRETSSRSYGHSTSQVQAEYAATRAQLLFGCYRRGDANDPDTYVRAIAAVLSLYDTDLIREVTDPRSGIQTTEKHMTFMPQPGELRLYCEGIAARRERMRRLGERRVPDHRQVRLEAPEPQPGDLANVLVRSNHSKYERVCKWAETADKRLWRYVEGGIMVGYNALGDLGCIRGGTGMADIARELAESIRKQRAAE